jgi:predicted transposase/invertase (TIGR01784 family)
MPEPLLHSHDRFFKEVFSRQETARNFLEHYLPPQVAALLDFSTLQVSKDTFIDTELQEHFSDLLYQVSRYDGQGTNVYILFEHKSYPDSQIAFQLLRYMVRIWEQALKQDQPLQPIVPLVIYHGRSRWNIPLEFSALFDLPEELRPYLPEYQYQLYDLTAYGEEEIKGEITLRVTLLLLKYIFREDFGQRLGRI